MKMKSNNSSLRYVHQQNDQIDIISIRIVRDNEGNSRGFAYVDVAESYMIEEACKMHGAILKGATLNIKKADPPSAKDKCDRTVFVNNLPISITEQKLHSMFKLVCAIISMEI